MVLFIGYAGKGCRGWLSGHPMSFLCHSDIRALYDLRGMDRDVFPYVHGRLIVTEQAGPPMRWSLHPVGGANEYPVLTGILMWGPSLVVSGADGYLAASALLLAPFGLVTAWLLGRMSGMRAMLWAASPCLLLYAFHNWELPVVAAVTAGLWSWWRGKPWWAAVWFGVGGALKLYPLLFLAPLAMERWFEKDRRGAFGLAAIGVGAWAAINLPLALASPSGWAVAFRFHALRPPNYDSLWGELASTFHLSPGSIELGSTAIVLVALTAVILAAWRRARSDGRFPFLQTCAALLAAFLLGNKVNSPQYALWVLPFFVVVGVRLRWYVLFVVGNVVLYVAIFGVSVSSIYARDVIVTWSVWIRTASMVALAVVFLRGPSAVGEDDRRPVPAPHGAVAVV
jgi:uncharacterized membrane protein